MGLDITTITKAIESHRTGVCHSCPYEGIPRCFDALCRDANDIIKKLAEESKADTVKKTIDAVKARANCYSHSCLFSGEIHETYSISGKALNELTEELREGV